VQEIEKLKKARGTAETLAKKPSPTEGAAAAPSPKEAEYDRLTAELEVVKKELNGLRDTRSAEFGESARPSTALFGRIAHMAHA